MNKVYNSRVIQLIKSDLKEYGLNFAYNLLALIGLLTLANLFITSNFGMNLDVMTEIHENINVNVGAVIFGNITSFVMLICGMVAGSMLSKHVRLGISRQDYYVGTVTAAAIVCLLIPLVFSFLNLILNLTVGSSSLIYNSLNLWEGNILTLLAYIFNFISMFLLGYFFPVLWQKVGWKQFIIIIVLILFASGTLTFSRINFNALQPFRGTIIVESIRNWEFVVSLNLHLIPSIINIVILTIINFFLLKDISVRVK